MLVGAGPLWAETAAAPARHKSNARMPKCFAEDLSESSFGPSSPYFSTMAIPLVQGRGFRTTDTADSPRVAIGNEHFVKTYYPGFDPIGKRFRLGGQRGDSVEVVRAASGAEAGAPPERG